MIELTPAGGRAARVLMLIVFLLCATPASNAMPVGTHSWEPRHSPVPSDRPTGRAVTVAGRSRRHGDGRLYRFRVAVEGGLRIRPRAFARRVTRDLFDDRGWLGAEWIALQRVTRAPDFTIVLASPATTDRLCAPLRTYGRLSCHNGPNVVLNLSRWRHGAAAFESVARYRTYLVNHEVGHALGYAHLPCPKPGAPAPVMMTQTLGVGDCRPNPWPLAWER